MNPTIQKLALFACVLSLLVACQPAGEPSNSEKDPAKNEAAAQATPEKPKAEQEGAKLEGTWTLQIEEEAPLLVTKTKNGYHIDWDTPMDGGILLKGDLEHWGNEKYSGQVIFENADSEGEEEVFIYMEDDMLKLELLNMYDEPLAFHRFVLTCAAMARQVVEESQAFEELMGEAGELAMKHEDGPMEFHDLRAYSAEMGEDVTLARFRVDFTAKTLSRYDDGKSEYVAIQGSEQLFEGRKCHE